jgi:hypothetical protein
MTYPEWIFGCHGGNCGSCAIQFGHGFVNTNEIDECPVCYENKEMTILKCKHKLCWGCWSTICNNELIEDDEDVDEDIDIEFIINNVSETISKCPLCRDRKW